MSVTILWVDISLGSIRTAINDANIHAKRFAREVGNVRHVVAVISKRYDPVEDGGPDAYPCCEGRVDDGIVHLDDVVDGVIEQRDQSGHSNNSERLTG